MVSLYASLGGAKNVIKPKPVTPSASSRAAIVVTLDSFERYRFLSATPISGIKPSQLSAKLRQGELAVIEARLRASRSEKDVNAYFACVRSEAFEPRYRTYALEAIATLCLADATITNSKLQHMYTVGVDGVPKLTLEKGEREINLNFEAGLPPLNWDGVRGAERVNITAQGKEVICKMDPTLCRECSKFDRNGVKYVNASNGSPSFIEKASTARLTEIRDRKAPTRLSHLLEAEPLGELKRKFPSLNVEDVLLFYPDLQPGDDPEHSLKFPKLCVPCHSPAKFNEEDGTCRIEKCDVGQNFNEGKPCPLKKCDYQGEVVEEGRCVDTCAHTCKAKLGAVESHISNLLSQSQIPGTPFVPTKEFMAQLNSEISEWRRKVHALRGKSKGCKDQATRMECQKFSSDVGQRFSELYDEMSSSFECPKGRYKLRGIGCGPNSCKVCAEMILTDIPHETSFGSCNATLMHLGRLLFLDARSISIRKLQRQCFDTKGRSDILNECIKLNNPVPQDFADILQAHGIHCQADPSAPRVRPPPSADPSVGE